MHVNLVYNRKKNSLDVQYENRATGSEVREKEREKRVREREENERERERRDSVKQSERNGYISRGAKEREREQT